MDLVCLPRPHNLHVYVVVQVLHCFAERRVVHQLVKVRLEVAFGLLAKLRVHPDVRLHPGLLIELQNSMNLLQAHALDEIKLQIFVMCDVLLFALQRRKKLLGVWRLKAEVCHQPLMVF